MQQLAEHEVLALIQHQIPFEAQLADGSLTIRISEYQPFVATAIHHGGRLRPELVAKCHLSAEERYFEEDPYTGEFISSMPIVLQGEDSRYEYDLNRAPEHCIYSQAWGKDVWHAALTDAEKQLSQAKHACYYRIFRALITSLERKFGYCVVYDIHSYNHERITTPCPTFNLGTAQVDRKGWHTEINDLLTRLGQITLPNIAVTAGENLVFQGMGYQATFIRDHFSRTLILPIEIKKVYMNESGGESYPLVIEQLNTELKDALTGHAAYVMEAHMKQPAIRRRQKAHVLDSKMPKEVIQLDRQLYKFARGLNTLSYINPINLKQEKRRFLHNRDAYQPKFTYRQLDLDPYKFREQLYRLPVEEIRDAGIQAMYRKVIDQLAVRIDLLTSLGHEAFLYNSLRYYGRPDESDIANANFILHARDDAEPEQSSISAEEAIAAFHEAADDYGFTCKIQGTTKLIARAMVSGTTVKVNLNSRFSPTDLYALIHHEMGVHMVTSVNAEAQPLKVLQLGLPGNTHTQEGLAILCEHLSGNFPLHRLKTLALRVVAVDMMVNKRSFNETFNTLKFDYGLSNDTAFTITTRAYRGGGFTKDYLYLRGLKDALRLHKETDLTSLFIGKTGFEFKPLLDELIEREILMPPQYLPKALSLETETDPIINFMLNCIN
ncbi:flavohemoglobin expression-modulating QEGLA motif protein (plasmid) [Photobacterium sp. GJ3]|uniref:flavohemoglobin expression-modulating QEGLA motif protein n=1 Tax=Photobacterium sp. GJ3 TaxID=2829502 RepID=UPI001B8D23F2|nr:flavohemoglobin expression-modulating QEGLA motif protein [Photobacterium sp. GJ3]QUJ69276.1 flavohemoglobin expression-modulating QEGLA motif protein [Photobacterium sp. GJ3]